MLKNVKLLFKKIPFIPFKGVLIFFRRVSNCYVVAIDHDRNLVSSKLALKEPLSLLFTRITAMLQHIIGALRKV